MRLIVRVSPMQAVWAGYKRWAGYSLYASDGKVLANGHIRLSHLHELTAVLFAQHSGDNE